MSDSFAEDSREFIQRVQPNTNFFLVLTGSLGKYQRFSETLVDNSIFMFLSETPSEPSNNYEFQIISGKHLKEIWKIMQESGKLNSASRIKNFDIEFGDNDSDAIIRYDNTVMREEVSGSISVQEVSLDISAYKESLWSLIKLAINDSADVIVGDYAVSAISIRFSLSTPNISVPVQRNDGTYFTKILFSIDDSIDVEDITLRFRKDSQRLAEVKEIFSSDIVKSEIDFTGAERLTFHIPADFIEGFDKQVFANVCSIAPIFGHLSMSAMYRSYSDGVRFAKDVYDKLHGAYHQTEQKETSVFDRNITYTKNLVIKYKSYGFSLRNLRINLSLASDSELEGYSRLFDNPGGIVDLLLQGKPANVLHKIFGAGFARIFKDTEIGFDAHEFIETLDGMSTSIALESLEAFKWKAMMIRFASLPKNYRNFVENPLGEFSIKEVDWPWSL